MTPFLLHYWNEYSRKLRLKILRPMYLGKIGKEDIRSEEMRLVIHEEGSLQDGYLLRFYVLVDESDGIIADIKYECFGDSALFGAAEILCDLAIRKNYDQAMRLTADLLEKEVKEDKKGFPPRLYLFLNLVLSTLDGALTQCQDIPFASTYAPPSPFSHLEGVSHEYPHFADLTLEQKKGVIQKVLDEDVKPYVELDAGGVEISAIEGMQLTVRYQGSCTSCFSATGATLSAIQHILKTKVHPGIEVVADPSSLTFATDHHHDHEQHRERVSHTSMYD